MGKTENFNAAGYAENNQPKRLRSLKKSHVAFSFEIMDLEFILVEGNRLQLHLPASKYVKGRSKSMLAKTCRQSEGVDG